MMDKRLSEKILQHFDFKTMEILQEYVSDRCDECHTLMDTITGADDFRKLQGEVKALKQLLKIRDHAVAIIERDR